MPPRAITQVCPQCEMPLVLPATFIGKTVACSRCGHQMLVSSPAEDAVLDMRPPHLREPTAVAQLPSASDAPIVQGDYEPQKRSCLYTGCFTVVLAAVALSVVMGVAVAAAYLVHWGPRPTVGGDPPEQEGAFSKRHYTDASRKALTISGVSVRIDKVQLGKVDYRSKGEILQTATPHYLIVNVNVKNKGRGEPVTYLSWYDHQFEDDAGQRQDVELRDDKERRWQVFLVPGADQVERHIKSDTELPLDDDITDSLVFKLPQEYVDEPIPPLYLKLPGAAVGNSDDYRFHLPAIMVDRRDR